MTNRFAQQFNDEMLLRGYSPLSIATYIRVLDAVIRHYSRQPDEISDADLREYVLGLIRAQRYERSTLINIICGLRLFYRLVLRRALVDLYDVLPVMKSPMKLPRIYGKEDIARLLNAEGLQMKHRTMLITAYSSGLRVGELCRLRVADILPARMQIRVREGKGRKERFTILSPKLLNILRNYWRHYRPTRWLFPSPYSQENSTHPVCAQQSFKRAVQAADLPNYGIHSLRHSFATHMYESGVDLPTLQMLLGHRWLVSTAVYIHLARPSLSQVRSPLDFIDVGGGAARQVEGLLEQDPFMATLAHSWFPTNTKGHARRREW